MTSIDEDALHTGIRQFMKTFGVSAQRELKNAVRDADSDGKPTKPSLPANAVLTVDGVDLNSRLHRAGTSGR
jgi:hypothetical protein